MPLDYTFYWRGWPVAFHISGFAVTWYSLMNIAAFIFGFVIFVREVNRESIHIKDAINPYRFFRKVFWGAYIGSRLWYCFFDAPSHYLQHPLDVLKVWEGGRASFGGLVGATIAVLAGKKERAKLLWLADRVSIPTAIGFALVRVGNFMNSEIIGIPTGTSWGVIFSRIDNLPRHPAQLYEIIVYLISCIILIKSADILRQQDGRRFGLFLLTAYGGRLIVESLKERTSEIVLDPWLCVTAVLVGIGLLIKRKGSYEKILVPAHQAID